MESSSSASTATASASARTPLGELSLAMFILPPNGASSASSCSHAAKHSPNAHPHALHATPHPPSPVSLPLKRGFPSQTDEASGSTIKRRGRPSLGDDELGTGRSPARRLFASDSPSAPIPSHTVAIVPPTPVSKPRRSSRLAAHASDRDREREREQREQRNQRERDRPRDRDRNQRSSDRGIHDPGFVVLSDDDPRARPHKATAQRVFDDPSANQENTPPPCDDLDIPSPSAPTPGRRVKNFERSKLCHLAASASTSPPQDGKEAMKIEAEGVECVE